MIKNYFNENIPLSDIKCYNKFKSYRKFYNRLNIFKLQNISADNINVKPLNYPVFVKPKINLMGGNKKCFIINNNSEYNKVKNDKELFWSSLISGPEGSFDIAVSNGEIIWYIHYQIFHEEGYLEKYKIINDGKKLPNNFIQFIKKYFDKYHGFLNLQYRFDYKTKKNIIIELGLRFDGGGRFINVLNDRILVEKLNNFYLNKIKFKHKNSKKIYVDKVSVYKPLLFKPPLQFIKYIIGNNKNINYHYYLESGNKKTSWLNIYGNKDILKFKNKLVYFYYIYNFIILFIIFIIIKKLILK